jgi:hypothetical protein
MSDIFLSYASEDRPKAAALAQALEGQGWSVWWDRTILAGQEFDLTIQEALTTAGCVVVLWSAASIRKRWVRDEAEEGAQRGRLIPVLIEEVSIPLGFRRLQAERLLTWDPSPGHTELNSLVAAIRAALGRPPAVSSANVAFSPGGWRTQVLLLLSLPTVLALTAVALLHYWRVPTHVQVSLSTTRAEFTLGSTDHSVEILKAVPFEDLTLEKFSAVRLKPERLDVANPKSYNRATRSYPDAAWSRVARDQPIELVPEAPQLLPKVTFGQLDDKEAGFGTVHAVLAPGGTRVVLEVGADPGELTLSIGGQDSRTLIAPAQQTGLVADHVTVKGITLDAAKRAQSVTYRVTRQESSPHVEAQGGQEGLLIGLTVPPESLRKGFGESPIPVARINFQTLDKTGRLISTLVGRSEVAYPEYPQIEKRIFGSPAFLQLDGLQRFSIREIMPDPSTRALGLSLEGIAGQVRSVAGGSVAGESFITDYRLTRLDLLRHNAFLLTLLVVALWVFPTTIGAYRLQQEFMR